MPNVHLRLQTLLSFAVMLFAFIAPAQAVLRIDITKGHVQPMPVALPDLAGHSIGQDIIRVVAADLERSGLFKPISQDAYIEQVTAQTGIPRFADWRQVNAAALITGTVTSEGGNKIRVAFRLWDVYGEEQIAG